MYRKKVPERLIKRMAELAQSAAKLLATEPVSVQLRYLQTLAEIGVKKNTTVIFPQLAEKALDSGAGPETFAHTPTKPAASRSALTLSCWAFWSRSSVIHVQGTIS